MKILHKRIDEIAEVIAGQSPPSSTYNIEGKGLPFFQGKADYGDKYPNVRFWCSEPTKISLPGDILISVRAPVGPVNINHQKSCIGRGLTAIRVNKHTSGDYVYFFLKLNESTIAKIGVGSTFMSINQKDVKALTIPIPEKLEDQICIANIFNKAEALIGERKESIRLLDEFLMSSFLEMFGDPVRNERAWPLMRLPDIGESRLGKMLDGKKIIGNNLKPYLRNTNVLWFKFNLDELLQMDFDEKDKVEFNLKNGDILMCEGGEIGRCAIWRNELEDCYFQKAIHRIRLNKGFAIPEFFVYMFWVYAKSGGLRKFMGAATISHLTGEKLKGMKLPIPPIKLQSQFAHIVKKTEILNVQYQTSLHELENLYGSLGQKAFKGLLDSRKGVEVIPLPILQEQEDNHFLKRKVLATYIINQSLSDTKFGHTKFEKLLHLSDYYAIKRNLGQKYYQQAAGPYDNSFTRTFFIQVGKSKWFKREKRGTQFIFSAGTNHSKSWNGYNYFSSEELQRVDKLITFFKKSDYEQPEIISTLYAVWNNRIIKGLPIDDKLIKADFLDWDSKKVKYRDRLNPALTWMRKEGLVPDGWGEVIQRPKSKQKSSQNRKGKF